MTKSEIENKFESFIDEIDLCSSPEEAKDIMERYVNFCKKNDISLEENYLIESGFLEMLQMLL